jgi:hypothetical protein
MTRRLHRTDAVMAATLLPLVAFEVYAITNRLPGDTISERTRVYFQVKGKAGSYIFLAFLGSASAWFAAHVVQRPV